MPNHALRQALADRALTPQRLAETVGVDVKTVARWMKDERRLPHPRHRWAVAAALEVEEQMIWPNVVCEALKTGPDREIVTVYPCRSAMPRSLWRDLVTAAGQDLTLAGYTSYFLWLELPNLANTLRRMSEQGAQVRFLVGDPDSPVTAERERIEAVPLTLSTRIQVTLDELRKVHDRAPDIEARFSDRHIAMSVWRFDDDMIVCTHLADLLGHDSPTLHLRRRQADGLFDRYAAHIDHLWKTARPVWPGITERPAG